MHMCEHMPAFCPALKPVAVAVVLNLATALAGAGSAIGSPSHSTLSDDASNRGAMVAAPSPPSCAVIEQANCVSGTTGLGNHSSTATVKFLGVVDTPQQCR